MLQSILFIVVGLIFGVANIIPGVSGGTIAVVFGLYERLIGFIADIRHRWKKDLSFILPFGIGAVIGIILFGKLMKSVLTNHPTLAQAFFVGVILGSIPMLVIETFKTGGQWKLSAAAIVPGLITLGLMIWLGLVGEQDATATTISGPTVIVWLKLLLWGVVAASCMIIPGISGSLVLTMLGGYGIVISAVGSLTSDISHAILLIPFAIGALIGLFGCAKLIKLLLRKWKVATYSAILGFVAGSLVAVFPGFSEFFQVWPVIWCIVGIAALTACNVLSAKTN